ncbi:MAG: AsmA-like C-terminal domain-containing protein, partial [Pseudomonadota bacterium]
RRVSLNLAFDRVTFSDAPGLRDATLAMARSGPGGLYADFNASAGEGFVTASVRPEPGGARYRVETDDFGAVLVALGAVSRAQRGRAILEFVESPGAAPERGAVWDGALSARGLVVQSAPRAAGVLSAASVVGLVDMASNGGITFTRVDAPFRVENGRLELETLTATGPSLGLTLAGAYDLERGQIDMRGSVSPAFVLNGLPSQVPVLGQLLTGGEGRGVVGFTFSVEGDASEPRTRINPLSPVMPGPLRRIFSRRDRDRDRPRERR